MTIISRKFLAGVALSVAGVLAAPLAAQADTGPIGLVAQFWQTAFSIPFDQNPLTDPDGSRCALGQRGDYWFLNTGWFPETPIRRTCEIPEDVTLFFPVLNYVNVSVPECDGVVKSEATLREEAKAVIDTVTDVKVTLDGKPIPVLGRLKSKVFSVVFPKGDLFTVAFNLNPLCVVVGKVYRTAIDDGIYAMVTGLEEGRHVLRIQARNDGVQKALVDTTYVLNVGKPDRH
jgi:hypothetical protein